MVASPLETDAENETGVPQIEVTPETFSETGFVALAGACVEGSDQIREKLDNFRDGFRQLSERWKNRVVLEKSSLAKLYEDFRIDIVLHGQVLRPTCAEQASIQRYFVIQIERYGPNREVVAVPVRDVEPLSEGYRRNYDDLVVLVDAVKEMEGVERPAHFVPVRARLYFIGNEPLAPGQGLLYRVEGGPVRHKFFPFFAKRKIEVLAGSSARPDDGRGEVVKGGSLVMDDIADDQREIVELLWSWLRGSKTYDGQPRIVVHRDFVEFLGGDSSDGRIKLLNVAVGPLNL